MLRRRELLVSTGGLLAGVVVAPTAAEAHGTGGGDIKAIPVPDGPAPPNKGEYVIGTIERSTGDVELVLRSNTGSLLTVRPAPGADLGRDGKPSLASFPDGEEVVVHGDFSDGALLATDVQTLFRGVDGHVESRTDRTIRVGGRVFDITSETRAGAAGGHGREQGRTLPNVKAGDHVIGVFRSNAVAATRTLVVLGRHGD